MWSSASMDQVACRAGLLCESALELSFVVPRHVGSKGNRLRPGTSAMSSRLGANPDRSDGRSLCSYELAL